VTLLGSKPTLHDIRDPIAYVHTITEEHRRQRNPRLTPEQWEDLRGYLLLHLVDRAQRYDQDLSPSHQTFSTYAGQILRRRITCWYRDEFTDTRYNQLPTFEPLTDQDKDRIGALGIDPHLIEMMSAKLSPRGQRTIRLIVIPILEHDHTETQIADQIGLPRRWVKREMAELRKEIQAKCLLAA
jgi:RNA polymerase sigma factor (sigma-70 family)